MKDETNNSKLGFGNENSQPENGSHELLQTNQQLSKLIEQYQFILEATQTGTWEWNVQTGETVFNEQWAGILGYTLSELQPVSIETLMVLTHPDDLKEAQLQVNKYFNNEIPFYQAEFRMKHRQGHWTWVLDQGRVAEWTSDGKPLLMLGTHQSINHKKETEIAFLKEEARLESLLKISQHSFTNIQELLDFALEEVISLTNSKIGYIYFYDDAKEEFTLNTWSKEVMKECHIIEPRTIYKLEKTGIWGEAVRQGKPIIVNDFAVPNPLKKGMPEGHSPLRKFLTIPVYSDSKIVAVVGVANKPEDYTNGDIRQLTLMMDAVWKIVQRQETELKLEKANRLYAVISQVNQAIVHNRDRQKLFDEICRIAIEFGKFRMAWIGVPDPQTSEVKALAVNGYEAGYLSVKHKITLNQNTGGQGPVGTCIRENCHFVCNDLAIDPAMFLWRDEALNRGYRSVIGLPLRIFGLPIAALAIYSDQVNFFNAEEIKLLEEVAYDISFALDAIETEKEHQKATAALKESEQRFRLFAQSAPVGILIVDQDFKFVFVSQQFTTMLGYTIDDMPNIDYWWNLAYPEPEYQEMVMKKWKEYLTNLKRSVPSNRFEPFEFRVCSKDGSIKNIEFHMAVQANMHYILLIDTTERTLNQNRLFESESKFRNLINQMQLGLAVHEIILDKDGHPVDYRFLDANPSFERITGLKHERIVGKTILEVLPKTEKIWIEKYGEVALSGKPISFESYAQEFGKYYSVVAYQPQPMQFAVLTQDITEQKMNLHKIEENSKKFQHLSRSATEMLELKTLDEIYEYISKSLYDQYPETIILFQKVDHKLQTSKLINIQGVSDALKKLAIKLSGRNIFNKEFKLIPEHLAFYLSGKLHHFEKGLADFVGTQFPKLAAKTIEKTVGIKQICTIGITKNEILHATIHLFNRASKPIADNEYIELFIKQAGIIIERAKTAELLAQSEEKYRLITENASDVIWMLNVNARKFTYISPAVMQLRGFTVEEAMEQTLEEAVAPESLIHIENALYTNLEKFLSNKLELEYYIDEIQQPCKDGRNIWVEVSTKFRFNNQGEIEVVGVSRNIEDRKKMVAAIKESEQKFHLLFENSPLGIYIANTHGEIEDANPALLSILGSPSLEMTKKINVLQFPPLVENGYAENFKKCIEENRIITIELPYTTHWGKKLFLSSYLVPLTNPAGNVEKVYTLMEDITLRKRNEEELIKLSLVAQQNPASIVITDLRGNIEYVNSKFTEVTGYTANEVMGKNPRVLKSGETSQEIYIELWKTILAGKEWKGEFHNRKKNGELYWEKANIIPIKNNKGRTLNYLAIKEDVTEQREAQLALIESENRLKEAVATKDKFFSIVSHDLRSPISSMLSLTELMNDPSYNITPEEMRTYTVSLHQTADSTYRLLENLLEWSRSQRGAIPFKPQQIDIADFLNSCDHSILEKAKNKHLKIEMKFSEGLTVVADENMLRSIMRNLVSNAIKFTKTDGKIQLEISKTAQGETLFAVIDNGIGMPLELIEKLFKVKENVSRTGTNNEASSGLGLILCKEFIEKHDGKIWVESEEGKGSIFYFTIP